MKLEVPTIYRNASLASEGCLFSRVAEAMQKSGSVELDFSKCAFLGTHAQALLCGLKLHRDATDRRTDIDLDSLNGRMIVLLANAGVLSRFGHAGNQHRTDTAIPLYLSPERDDEEIGEYVDHELLSVPSMPKMSDAVKGAIRRSFFDLLGNAFQHSESTVATLACGHVYVGAKIIQISIYDGGIGIAQRVRNHVPDIGTDEDAVEWALKRGNSTRGSSSPSGLGLSLLREFLLVNNGEFRVYCNGIGLRQTREMKGFTALPVAMQGTLIDLRIREDPDTLYIYAGEQDNGGNGE